MSKQEKVWIDVLTGLNERFARCSDSKLLGGGEGHLSADVIEWEAIDIVAILNQAVLKFLVRICKGLSGLVELVVENVDDLHE